jgi:hypothetical protein
MASFVICDDGWLFFRSEYRMVMLLADDAYEYDRIAKKHQRAAGI